LEFGTFQQDLESEDSRDIVGLCHVWQQPKRGLNSLQQEAMTMPLMYVLQFNRVIAKRSTRTDVYLYLDLGPKDEGTS
jgi:hypothetical protein